MDIPFSFGVVLDFILNNKYWLLGGLIALWLLMRWRRSRRARRPAIIHPSLQKYQGLSPAELASRRVQASQIIATSSTGNVAGYEIVRQIEAVFEDGHRSPAEAIESVKAAAAQRGANAVGNLSQQRTTSGRCAASGDAVVVKPIVPPKPPVA